MNQWEIELVAGLRAGLESSFEDFRRQFGPAFYYYFRHHGLSEIDATDLTGNCVQDIPLKIITRFPATHTSLVAWVNTLRNRVLIDWLRRRKGFSHVELNSDQPDPRPSQDPDAPLDPDPPQLPAEAAVADALSRMDPVDREVLAMRCDDNSFADIAADLSQRYNRSFNDTSMRKRHARALVKLKERISHDPRLMAILNR